MLAVHAQCLHKLPTRFINVDIRLPVAATSRLYGLLVKSLLNRLKARYFVATSTAPVCGSLGIITFCTSSATAIEQHPCREVSL